MLSPTCPLTNDAAAVPECGQRLVLRECIERRAREAQFGVCDNGRYRCRYVVWGRGPTLVLIPGLASDALSLVMLMARLQTQFRCVSYDYPDGIADGARLTTYRHADYVGDFFALLDHLHVRDCFLYGSSFGSTIALTALHQHPGRFARALLQGGFARRRLSVAEILVASFARFLPGRLGHLPLVGRVQAYNHQEPFLQRAADVWDFYMEQTCKVPLRAFASRVLMVNRLDLRPILPALSMPVLVVCGDRDMVVGKTCEQELMAGLPRVGRAEIERCGHEPHLTHPEVLAEVVRQFLV